MELNAGKSATSPGSLRRALYTFIAVVLGTALVLCLSELVCRITPLGDAPRVWPSRLAYQQVRPAFREITDSQGRTWCVGQGQSPIRPCVFPLKKGPRSFRVFVFGGSAAWGFGYYGGGAFPALMQRLLAARFPERDIEVLNLAQVGYASPQILARAEEALERFDPDLLLVYEGHNEGLELKALLGRPGNSLEFVKFRLNLRRRSALYRGLAKLANFVLYNPDHPLQDPAGVFGLDRPFDAVEAAWVNDQFRQNLDRLAGLAAQRRVPLLLSSVVWNSEYQNDLPDRCPYCEPIEPRSIPDEMPEQQARQALAVDWAYSLLERDRGAEAAALVAGSSRPDARYIALQCGLQGPQPEQALAEIRGLCGELGRAGVWRNDERLAVLYVDMLATLVAHNGDGVDRLALQEAYRRLKLLLLPALDDPTGRQPYQLAHAARLTDDRETLRLIEARLLQIPLPTADQTVNQVIRNMAGRPGVLLVDADAELRGRNPQGNVGYDLLLDYCHFNYQGALQLAALFAEAIERNGLLGGPGSGPEPNLPAAQIEQGFWRRGHDETDLRWFVGVGPWPVLLYDPIPSLSWRAARAQEALADKREDPLLELYAAYVAFIDNQYPAETIEPELLPRIERARQENPRLSGLLSTQAWLELFAGRPEAALELLERADPALEPDAALLKRWIESAPRNTAAD